MIVTCPSCTARYKIDEAKIQGRGAKITCPTCKHKFVVYREGEDAEAGRNAASTGPKPPADIARRDFRTVGVAWKVRKGIGVTYDIHDLSSLRELIAEGQVDKRDVLSYDAREWKALSEIADLEAWFWSVWQKAERGEIQRAPAPAEEDDDEDASDAPTTIVGHGSSLADEIRKAVQDARTPAPVQERGVLPTPQPTANVTAPAPLVRPAAPIAAPAPAAAPIAAPVAAPAPAGSNTVRNVAIAAVVLVPLVLGALWVAGVFGAS